MAGDAQTIVSTNTPTDGLTVAERLLYRSVGYWDVKHWDPATPQVLRNRGRGGARLDAQFGSSSGADTNDPLVLPAGSTPYVYLPGVAGNYLSVPDAANLDITDDIEIICRVSLAAVPTSAAFVAKWDTAPQNSYLFAYSSNALFLYSTADGSTSASVGVTHTPVAGAIWYRVTRVKTTGAVNFYSAPDQATEPVSWTQIGTQQTGVTTAWFSGTSTVAVGQQSGVWNWAGSVYRAIVRNGIGGTTVLDVNTSVITSGSISTFAATTGQTVTINRSTAGRKTVIVTGTVALFGTDDYLTVPDNDLVDFNNQAMTVVAVSRRWNQGAAHPLVTKRADGGGAGWDLYFNSTAGARFLRQDGSTTQIVTPAVSVTAGAAILSTGIYDGAAQPSASTNTSAITGTGTIPADTRNAIDVRIGAGSGATFADMELVLVAVDRRAFNTVEIAALAAYAASRMS